MSCKYCELKMRPISDSMKGLRGESWGDELGESGYIEQAYDDRFRMHVYHDAKCLGISVNDIKYCPFCGAKITMPAKPQIEDEWARKIIKSWYGRNNIIGKLRSYGSGRWLGLRGTDEDDCDWKIELRVHYDSLLGYDKLYSLTELIGEEE